MLYQKLQKYYPFLEPIFPTEEIFFEYLLFASKPLSHYSTLLKTKTAQEIVENSLETEDGKYFYSLSHYIEKQLSDDISKIKKESISIKHISQDGYPQRLLELQHPPRFIFYKGDLDLYIKSIAIVGTREIDKIGVEITKFFASEATKNDLKVVSGAAKGVDQTAQQECLTKGGSIIVVLGSGLTPFLSSSLYSTYKKHEKQCLIISEFPLQFTGNKSSFPIRNRIISALSLGTILVQAPQKSGALYTAEYTISLNKPVFIPPVGIFQQGFKGNIELLKRRDPLIYIIDSIEDILEHLQIIKKSNDMITISDSNIASDSKIEILSEKTPTQKILLSIINNSYPSSIHIDNIIKKSGFPIQMVQKELLELILMGDIDELAGHNYTLK
ncbi:DNA-processing protein DprA [bacterium]|nr:DNA-processing protein DprA [bacterium]